jgi:hypothetical protein
MFTGIDAKEVEKFSSLFKSQSVKTNFVFEIVVVMILKYYSEDSYAQMRGSLAHLV